LGYQTQVEQLPGYGRFVTINHPWCAVQVVPNELDELMTDVKKPDTNRALLRGIPDAKGSYILLFSAQTDFAVKVGKFGRCEFKAGAYAYCGSAFGPGGLRARLTRHIRKRKKKHWHIDYVRPHLSIEKILTSGEAGDECRWSTWLIQSGIGFPIKNFGSSDCACAGHFFHARSARDFLEILKKSN